MAIRDTQAIFGRFQWFKERSMVPAEVGPNWVRGTRQLLDKLLVPRDPRGIVLLCGFIAAGALGVSALLFSDPIGYAYLAAVAFGYFFLQTRLVPALLWVLLAVWGAAIAAAGNSSGWVACGLSVLLALVSLIPVPVRYRFVAVQSEPSRKDEESRTHLRSDAVPQGPQKSESSIFLEDLPALGLTPAESLHSNGNRSLSTAVDSATHAIDGAVPRPGSVAIRTIGRLRLGSDDRGVTQRLNEQPRLEFLLSFLIARAVLYGDAGIERSGLADEVAPGFPARSQRDRLRKQLHALQGTLGPQLKGLVRVNRTHVSLDLREVQVDVMDVLEMGRLVSRRSALIDEELADKITQLLELTAGGEFLSGFSELEHQVTEGRGGASQVVEEARVLIGSCRADLVRVLAEYQAAIGRPRSSIAFLQTALIQSPERQDLARLLVAAYLQTGQSGSADKTRREYGLIEEK
jgi:hypothetical protein